MGRFDEGLAELKRAQELDPLSLVISNDTGEVLFFARRYDEAIEQLHKTLEIDNGFFLVHVWLVRAYAWKGAYPEAFREIRQLSNVVDRLREEMWLYSLAGDRGKAQRALKEWTGLLPQTYNPAFDAAVMYGNLGDMDKAFSALETVYQERLVGLISLKTSPMVDPLRRDPRFDDLLRRMHFIT